MAIIGTIDCGVHPTWLIPLQTYANAEWGIDNSATVTVQQSQFQTIDIVGAGKIRQRTETIWVRDPGESPTGVATLVRQLMELAGSPGLQPVTILWKSGGGIIVPDVEDGWYLIKSVKPDFENVFTGIIPVQITVSYLAPLPPSAHGMAAFGGLGFSSAGNAFGPYTANTASNINWLAFHPNATVDNSFTRVSADGNIPILLQNPTSLTQPPVPFQPSATIADWYRGRVRVYDTINTSSNPVPIGGGFVNANWIEIFQSDHKFQGDMVITNGILLFLVQVGVAHIASMYWWNSTTWLLTGTIDAYDALAQVHTNRGAVVYRQSWDEVGFRIFGVSPNGSQTNDFFRLQRGAPFVRVANAAMNWSPNYNFASSGSTNKGLQYAFNSAVAMKIITNDQAFVDPTLDPAFSNIVNNSTTGSSAYSILTAFGINNSFPYAIQMCFLAPGQQFNGQPVPGFGSSTLLYYVLDSVQLNWNYFSFGVVPIATPASYQIECENATLAGALTTVVDAAASNGHAVKLASGTGTIVSITASFGTPPGGSYRIGVRYRASSAAPIGAVEAKAQFLLNGLPVDTTLTFGSTIGSTGVSPTTIYSGATSQGFGGVAGVLTLIVGVDGTPIPGGTTVQVRITNTGSQITHNASVDWFFDDIFLIPDHLTTDYTGPTDQSQQYNFDRTTKFIAY